MKQPNETLRLSDFLPFQLSALSNTISRNIAQIYDAEFGLTIWQWRIMAVVGETAGVTATAITERTAMDKVAVSRAVSGLIELGYVERRPSDEDGRRSLLYLTDIGMTIYREIVPLALQHERAITDALSPDELATFKTLLNKLADIASPDRALW